MTGVHVSDNQPALPFRADDPAGTTAPAHQSPRPQEPDVHLTIFLQQMRFDFTACLSAALEFVHEQQTHHYADDVTVDLHDTRRYPRLPNERLFLRP
ncbi:hypothetical protein [Nocardia sp. NPDC057455]|uniref:hypothetical protein n=1 Tax=Nocardia sp. NPDC057455 TaxID=3346138 RepID=UPI00366D7A5B